MLAYYENINDFLESDWYKAIRLSMPPNLRTLGNQELDKVLKAVMSQLPGDEQEIMLESFGKIAKSIGKGLKNNAGIIGTVGGGLVGGVVGGPAGAALGAKLGGSLGGTVAGNKQGQTSQKRTQARRIQSPVGRPSVSIQSSPANAYQIRQKPEMKALMITNQYQFLIQVMQSVIESVLKVLLQNRGSLSSPKESVNEGFPSLESFSNAIAVFGEEAAIRQQAEVLTFSEDTEGIRSPKERADHLFESLFPY